MNVLRERINLRCIQSSESSLTAGKVYSGSELRQKSDKSQVFIRDDLEKERIVFKRRGERFHTTEGSQFHQVGA